ncbi:MAG: chromosome segregation protein SMC [Burkholderiaceae bacterium]|nr:chromosome segregation protein SMC [Burkholderiaceae bacterium]
MRLKLIRLSGFKSFVDPTVLEMPGQLVGVVGPNGCGKSNIMDAVRWVLGESRASELRGESMQDVIFSGSSERKPSGRASVELVFDNSSGRIGGAWGGFTELSVKRVLTRDGQSTYLINNQVVRRKDVHDIFLGTGLGPRAYAMIGQGMISRIIEARPEDLRVFLEEAAGVSRYKERRRETEQRLAGTRENLVRVNDIARELGGQVERLERQAEVASQYRSFEADRNTKQQMLWLVRRDEALAEKNRVSAQRQAAASALEERIAQVRAVETELETVRSAHYDAGDAVHAAQGSYYDANVEVGRIESQIRYVVESQGQMGERITTLDAQAREAREDATRAHAAYEEARKLLDATQGDAERLAQEVIALGEAFPAVEARVKDARTRLEQARAAALETRQSIELSATRRRGAEQALGAAERRRERLETESGELQMPSDDEIAAVRAAESGAAQTELSRARVLEEGELRWKQADEQRAPAQVELREADARLAKIDARIVALRQIQERAESQARIVPWLERHGLSSLGRLWQRLHIDDGWETAIESVLRERVESREVGRLEHVAALASDAPPAKVSFHTTRGASPARAPDSPQPREDTLRPLVSVVRDNDPAVQSLLADWLHDLFAAEAIEQAMARIDELGPGASFVTPQGHQVGRRSIRLYAVDSEQEGLLARQHELDQLSSELRARQLASEQARARAMQVETAAAQAATALSLARDEHSRAVRELATRRLETHRVEQQVERAQQVRGRIGSELHEVSQTLGEARSTIEHESTEFERLDAELARRQQRAEELAFEHERVESELGERREALRSAERVAQEASFAAREIQGRIERFEAQIDQASRIERQCRAEREQCELRLAELSDATARAALELALQARVSAEHSLGAARQRLDELSHSLRSLDESRQRIEREHAPLREQLMQLQLGEQAAELNATQFSEQLAQAGAHEAQLRQAFPEPPKPSWLQGEVTRLGNAIAALGAVNLAALDELDSSLERKGFLDAQTADLDEAIATLEDAIRRIDRETRELLSSTYESVNAQFGRLFPELFGGGEARLVLTGGEILDAGVQVIAQPPGKRNTSIHLLSGGEKALTAIALVFAMFQLNPAPFCLLDEVDAPLDDANTERYCDMVRRMSEQTQFVFITHNKIAMELAQQLVGVTMQERGVSRIVAVDLDSAARIAQAA